MNVEEIIKTKKEIPLGTRTIIHLSLVNNKLKETMGNALKPFEVSLQQFNVLRILRGQKGQPANLSTLNERMVSKMSNTTRLVDKLILKGYVKRCVCESNRRKVEIFITGQGENVLVKMSESMKNAESDALKNFTAKELENLNRLLDKF
ncbi:MULTISPECIES: MarR family winged helix-turn-helix transcriptional regulator [Croceitalea]|uniref:MarR family transcriptional regulator n=1 Tax=Croceitalea vernalis TaxID=3075599 RepID=A0ABU3BL55_9FLAO|nr:MULTISPECIES: MarR family transcriptional regulator [unclassified Croceitalea]MDT0541045.1 MarR family transcriptional regulator [Croceitalea sp. P059]MDT0622894.1 MarR family transcriptional regulator [Croceitalea sp. P007]